MLGWRSAAVSRCDGGRWGAVRPDRGDGVLRALLKAGSAGPRWCGPARYLLLLGVIGTSTGWTGQVAAASADSGLADAISICKSDDNPTDERIAACDQILAVSDLSAEPAALAHFYRGLAQVKRETPSGVAEIPLAERAQAAMPDLDAAIAEEPDFIAAYRLRANLRIYTHQYDAAATDFDKVIAAYPKIAGLHILKASTLREGGHYDAALAEFDTGFSLAGPDDDLLRYYWSRAYADAAALHLPQALADLDKAMPRVKTRREQYTMAELRGRLEFLSGNMDAALTELTKAQDTADEKDLYHLLWLYLVEARLGRDAARNLWERLPFADTTDWPGPILRYFAGDIPLDQVIVPKNKSARDQRGAQCELEFYLGELALAKGDRPAALEHLRHAIDNDITEYVEYDSARAELHRLAP